MDDHNDFSATRATPTSAFDRLRSWINTARLVPGDRLPPERTLSHTLGVSRAELRKGLALMELKGELERRVGRGTYLVEPKAIPPSVRPPKPPHAAFLPEPGDPLSIPALSAQTSPHSAMMARLAIEPQIASCAAIHATPQQLARLTQLIDDMRRAESWTHYEALDAQFHEALGAASGNVLLAELQRITNAVRVSVVWSRLETPAGGPPADYPSFAEHDDILRALLNRDRAAAHDAMRAHLKSIRARLVPED